MGWDKDTISIYTYYLMDITQAFSDTPYIFWYSVRKKKMTHIALGHYYDTAIKLNFDFQLQINGEEHENTRHRY
jgi:hypothetical protein